MEDKKLDENQPILTQKTIARRDGAKTQTFTLETADKRVFKYSIQQPTFAQTAEAMAEAEMFTRLNMAGSGKVIFNLCCYEHSPELLSEDNVQVLLSVCINLFDTYVSPASVQIKKN